MWWRRLRETPAMETHAGKIDRYSLKRTEQNPLVFQGELIAEVAGPSVPRTSRWHDLRLYLTVNRHFVVEIVLQTKPSKREKTDPAFQVAHMFASLQEAKTFLFGFDAMAGTDILDNPRFEKRRDRVAEKLFPVYHRRVDELFGSIWPE